MDFSVTWAESLFDSWYIFSSPGDAPINDLSKLVEISHVPLALSLTAQNRLYSVVSFGQRLSSLL
ncbi:protein of unknown function [Methylocaldum szegediense]|uniref:Uncharacterized protein n=1 Tax=Methylocaldum szegediense TaxID=73780 RepID=A0ABM9I4G6_9GAMM|nr:protein of unknown function [Methylocaldum szegediense]